MLSTMRRKCGLPLKESLSFQTKLLQESLLERAFVGASFRATGEEDFCPYSLGIPPTLQEPQFGARTLLRLPVRDPECAVATAWPCPVQQAQPWGLGSQRGPGASQEVAFLQQGCPSCSCHTSGVHPSHWDGAARAEPGNQMQILLGEDPCITGVVVVG